MLIVIGWSSFEENPVPLSNRGITNYCTATEHKLSVELVLSVERAQGEIIGQSVFTLAKEAIFKTSVFCWKPSMHQVNLKEAETQLADLIEKAAGGEEVVITRSDGSSFKIVPLSTVGAIPRFGSAKGLVRMSDDFDAPLEDFEEYAP